MTKIYSSQVNYGGTILCHQFWKDNNFQTLSFPPWIPNISPMGEISPRLRTPDLDDGCVDQRRVLVTG